MMGSGMWAPERTPHLPAEPDWPLPGGTRSVFSFSLSVCVHVYLHVLRHTHTHSCWVEPSTGTTNDNREKV